MKGGNKVKVLRKGIDILVRNNDWECAWFGICCLTGVCCKHEFD